jgi:putative oxidoreductase
MPPPAGLAGQYMGVLFISHYLTFVFAVQALGGALLLAHRIVPPALTLLGPILVNILLFHSLMAPEGLPIALFATVLSAILFYRLRQVFAGVFVQRVQV